MFISYLDQDAENRRWSCPIPFSRNFTHSGAEFEVSAFFKKQTVNFSIMWVNENFARKRLKCFSK